MPRSSPGVISHWHHSVEDFQTSPLEFYTTVEEAVEARGIPDLTISRVEWKEGGVGSAKRVYLRIQRETLAFDICAAPFGEKSFFFSWWLVRVPAMSAFAGLFILFTILWLLGLLTFLVTATFKSTCLTFMFPLIAIPVAIYMLGFGVQSGIISSEEEILGIPYVGRIYAFLFNPNAYFRHDSAIMYQGLVGRAVREAIDETLTEQGLRALSPTEHTPRIRDLIG